MSTVTDTGWVPGIAGTEARLSAVAVSRSPDCTLIGEWSHLSVKDIREVMRLLADREGWVTAGFKYQQEIVALRAESERLRGEEDRLRSCLNRHKDFIQRMLQATGMIDAYVRGEVDLEDEDAVIARLDSMLADVRKAERERIAERVRRTDTTTLSAGELAMLIERDWLIDPETAAETTTKTTEPGKCPWCGLPKPESFERCGGDACIPF